MSDHQLTMAPDIEQQWQFAQRYLKELEKKVSDNNTRHEDIQHMIQQLRVACVAVIFLDIEYASTHNVEAQLWDTHTLLNSRYRKLIARFKPDDAGNAVEKRKWEQRYVDFLKTSQYFYKGYVQRLASHFEIPELRKIAHRLSLSIVPQTQASSVEVSEDTRRCTLLSCHATLLRLGDLSRYRNVLRRKDRSWDVALAYYGLANDLRPDDGSAFNQMAIISLSEADHLLAIYHLYRALATKQPPLLAQGNLATEFKKIVKEWENGKKTVVRGAHQPPLAAPNPLVSWFVRLHAKLYKGEEFSGHEELEHEVLSQLTVLLKETPLKGVLDKFVLINIAAEYFAVERLRQLIDENNKQSYFFLLQLNVRTLNTLLRLLQAELTESSSTRSALDVTGSDKSTSNHNNLTPTAKRILPALRQYSTWLVANTRIINSQNGPTPLGVHIKEMWSMYGSTLTMLVQVVGSTHKGPLPELDYLLEEDAATVGFKPFRDNEKCKLYTNSEGLKPRTTDPGVERSHPGQEMLARVRDLLNDGVGLAQDPDIPIYNTGTGAVFRYVEEGMPKSADPQGSGIIAEITLHNPNSSIKRLEEAQNIPRAASPALSDSHHSMSNDIDMERMVEDLVNPSRPSSKDKSGESNETSYGMHSLTAADIFGLNESNRPVSRHQVTPLVLPTGSNIWGPTPDIDADRSLATSQISDLKFADRQQRLASAMALEQIHGSAKRNSSVYNSAPKSSLLGLAVDNMRPESLAMEGSPSSEFSYSSSTYASTPYHRHFDAKAFAAAPRNPSHNLSTEYNGVDDYDIAALIQSSQWEGGQPIRGRQFSTPPGGQGE